MPEWSDLAAVFSPDSPIQKAERDGRAPADRPPPVVTPPAAAALEDHAGDDGDVGDSEDAILDGSVDQWDRVDEEDPVDQWDPVDEEGAVDEEGVVDETALVPAPTGPAVDQDSPDTWDDGRHGWDAGADVRDAGDDAGPDGSDVAADGPQDRFADLGAHVAEILRRAELAGEEMKRVARAELEVRIAAVETELGRRQLELDQRERGFEHRMTVAEEEAAQLAVRASEEAERRAAAVQAEVTRRLASLLSVQDSFLEELDGASGQLRRTLASLATGDG